MIPTRKAFCTMTRRLPEADTTERFIFVVREDRAKELNRLLMRYVLTPDLAFGLHDASEVALAFAQQWR